jgi:hypothetical protein
MTDDEILQHIKDDPSIFWFQLVRRHQLTREKAEEIITKWQALQPPPLPIYKKEGKKVRKTKWNIGERLYENYSEWKEAMND